MKSWIVIVLLLVSIIHAKAALDDDLIAHYAFESNAQDVSGHNHDGIIYGNATFGDSSNGQSFDPDRANNYILASNPQDFKLTNDFSFGCWIKRTQKDDPSGMIMSCSADLNYNEYSGWYMETTDYDQSLAVTTYEAVTFSKMIDSTTRIRLSSGAGYADGQWHHAFVTVSSVSGTKLYMDGILVDSDNGTEDVYYDTESYFCMGNFINDGTAAPAYLDDPIDDVRVYDRVLSEVEVEQLAVPEPATLSLLTLGGLAMLRRRK